MPVDFATIGVLAGLIMPVYVALWSLNRSVGEISARTEHNEQAVEHISSTVDALNERATTVDARTDFAEDTPDYFSDSPA